ncbi:lytic transglycosylase domain-containing protein [Phenylobacterium sp.]|uniref:lytic transglycosylase domain-containing protein n=1 Tax=Phenylobacterium sp. TaxID=1871053 RepID=UPI00391CC237
MQVVGGSRADEPAVAAPGELGPARLPPLSQPFADAVSAAAERHRLDPKLLHALVTVESAYHPRAVSQAGAAGLTQLMPTTARELGVRDRFDPAANLLAGADYLARQLVRFGDLRLALAAYNAGPGRVAQLGRIPEIAETKAYVRSVVECYLALSAGRGVRSSRECPAPEALP